MAANSKIEWCHHTFNPWWGCVKVSEACQFCYAERDSKRYGFDLWGSKSDRRFFGEKHWDQPLVWDRTAQREGVRYRVFCASMADVFEDWRDLDESRSRLWKLVYSTPSLDWLLLTKRPENVLRLMGGDSVLSVCPNIWIGATVENQQRADERIPHLLKVPATVRFLSCEPMLGPLDLQKHLARRTSYHVSMSVSGAIRNRMFGGLIGEDGREMSEAKAEAELLSLQAKGVELVGGVGCDRFDPEHGCLGHPKPRIDWVIAGGESGPRARPMHPDWARSLRDQCTASGVPFHFKQWGEWVADTGFSKVPRMWASPDGIVLPDRHVSMDSVGWWPLRRVGKKTAGRLLDGREWNEFPQGLRDAANKPTPQETNIAQIKSE